MDSNDIYLSDNELRLIAFALVGYYRADDPAGRNDACAFYDRIRRIQMFRAAESQTKARAIAAEAADLQT
jgi:hypothetical protein